jgi:hypothetical protein
MLYPLSYGGVGAIGKKMGQPYTNLDWHASWPLIGYGLLPLLLPIYSTLTCWPGKILLWVVRLLRLRKRASGMP